MFSSPARPIKGTPRRTGTLSRAPRTPSIYLEREHEAIPPPSTARTKRLAHLRRDESPSTSVAETVRTVREVEGYEKISWSRDDRRAVNSLGALPKEVNALVKSLGTFAIIRLDPSLLEDGDSRLINGVVDTSSGYAMVATSSGCRAWSYVKVHPLNTHEAQLTSSVQTRLRHATHSPRPPRTERLTQRARFGHGRI